MKAKKKSIFKEVPAQDKKDPCKESKNGVTIHNDINIVVEQQEKEDGCTGCFKALFQALKR